MKYILIVVLFFCLNCFASEPPWAKMPPIPRSRSQDFPGVTVNHRGDTPPADMPQRVEGSRDLRKQAVKKAHSNRLLRILNCCKGQK